VKSEKLNMKKRGQFYLVATIIIVGLLIGLSVIFNYSTRSSSYGLEKITQDLSIESQKVMDYETVHPSTALNEFEDFSMQYSAYAGEDKAIYFILVEEGVVEEAYKYSDGEKVSLDSDLSVDSAIHFALDEKVYTSELKEGKNFYFILVYDKGGERYVYTG
jgi:hypothetical protein